MTFWCLHAPGRLRHAAVVVLGLAGLILSTLSVTTTTATAQASTCTVSATLVNSCRPWLGAAANSYPQAAADTQSQIEYHEQRIGRPVDIVHTYHPTGSNSLSTADVHFATRAQTMLFTDWNPTDTWANITNQNAAIDEMAASVKALGTTRILLTLWHEPENDVSSAGDPNCPNTKYKGTSGTVADYKNMWRYTTTRFASDGVRNVVWVMDYMNYSAFDCLVPDLWPGNDLVDWVMFNAYDNASPGSFTSPVDRFTGVLNAGQSATDDFASKPWGIAEWGSTLTPAQDQAFYDSAKAAVDANTYPRIKAYSIYDSDSGSVPANQDLRVAYDANHTADATKASHYYAFADDPALSGSYDPPPSPPDVTAPTVALTAPGDGDQVSGSVSVAGATSDDRAVSRVDLLVDGQNSGIGAGAPDDPFALSWDSTGVASGTHTLQLAASDVAGNVGHSALITVTVANTDTRAPSAPTQLAATTPNPGEVDLSWSAATDNVGVDHYVVYRDATVVGRTTGATTTFADTSVAPGTQYSYQVSAVDAAQNEGDLSSPRVVTTPAAADVTAPSAPTGVTAVPASSSEIDLHWNAATDNVAVTGYNVYRDATLVATVGSATSWADTGLGEASTHSYTITAVDGAGNESPPSPTVSASTADVTAPSKPTGVTAVVAGPNRVQVTWSAASDNVAVAGYHVYRDGTLLTTLAATSTTYTDTSVTDGRTYAYTVSAYDAAGNTSATSSAATVGTPDRTAPTVPSGLTGRAVSGTAVNLTWSAATDNVAVAGYNLFRGGVKIATLTGLTYTDSGLSSGHAYAYTVSAYDAAGNTSAQSGATTVSTADTTAPAVPTKPTVTAQAYNKVTVGWTAVTDNVGVAGYRVYRNSSQVATVVGATSYLDAAVTGSTTYSYTVSAYDAAGNASAPSAAASVTTPAAPDTTAPTVPSGLKATITSTKAVYLSWTGSTDNVRVAGYLVYRNGTLLAGSTKVNYTDSSAVQGGKYNYTVSAYDAAGNVSAQTAPVAVSVPDATPPTAPTGLTLTPGPKTMGLSWTAAKDNVGVAGYNIWRNGVKIGSVTAGTTYVDKKGLITGTRYSYYVVAYDASGNLSSPSATVTGVPR